MKTIGLIGGVASGKSLVAKMLVELGAVRFDADAAGHELLEQDAAVRDALRQRWGDDIFSDGRINRSAVARRVFGRGAEAAQERAFLEALLHPRIKQKAKASEEATASAGRRPAFVVDAPLLLEAGWGPMCDILLMVDALRETRLARALERGWSEAQFDVREAAQWPIVKKRSEAHVVIKNDGTEADLRTAVRQFWMQHVASASL